MTMTMKVARGLLFATLLTLLSAGVAQDRVEAAELLGAEFRLTIANLSEPNVPIREGAYLVHQRQHVFWSPDTLANEATERIAEVGTGAFAIVQLGAEALTANTEANGDSASWIVTARPGDLLSFVQMLAPTNDAFIGVDSLPLFAGDRPLATTFDLTVWDAGTEVNSPVGSGFDGGQPDTIHLEENLDNGEATSEPIRAHPQFPGVQARLSVEPLWETWAVGSGLRLLGWTGAPTAALVFLRENPPVSHLWIWNAGNSRWSIAAAALPGADAIVLARGQAVFLFMQEPAEIRVPLTPVRSTWPET